MLVEEDREVLVEVFVLAEEDREVLLERDKLELVTLETEEVEDEGGVRGH